MSMKAWAATLFAATFSIAWLWGVLSVPSFVRSAVMFQLGFAGGFTAAVLLPSGLVAAVTLTFSNSVTAMKTWWTLSILIAAFLAVGAFQVATLLGP